MRKGDGERDVQQDEVLHQGVGSAKPCSLNRTL